MLKYVECDISYSVNVKQVIVSYSTDGDCEVLKLFIPKHSTQTVMLPVHFRVCCTPSRSEKSPMRVNDCSQWVDGVRKSGGLWAVLRFPLFFQGCIVALPQFDVLRPPFKE